MTSKDQAEVEKRHLDADAIVSTMLSKKRKMDEESRVETESSQQQKVDPSELASAFALASLAGFGKSTALVVTNNKNNNNNIPVGPTTDSHVQNSLSFEETRSPEATQAPTTPDERSPGSPQSSKTTEEEPGSPESSKRVHFAPSTKTEGQRTPSSPSSTPSKQGGQFPQVPRRLAMPSYMHGNPSFPSPRPQGPYPYGGYNAAAYRSPPPMPHHVMHSPHAPFHHAHHQPWFHSPAMAASMAGRMAYPPQRLMQPPLQHPESNEWICDFCNVASFSSFEEACVHEEACRIRCSNKMTRGFPSYPMNTQSFPPPGHPHHPLQSRSASLEEDSPALSSDGAVTPANSDAWFSGTMSLAMGESDSEWLSELNCFIRTHCVEAFSANEDDVARSTKRGRISLQQVGIRCRYCAELPFHDKGVAAVSFPTSVSGIYESVKRWQRVHLEVCESVPQDIRNKLDTLSNTNVWVPTTRQYWSDSAKAMGLVDTTEGIRFGVDPKEVASWVSSVDGIKVPMMHKRIMMPPPAAGAALSMSPHVYRGPPSTKPISPSSSTDFMEPTHSTDGTLTSSSLSSPSCFVVFPEDTEMIPPYVYFLMRQVEPCRFTEADRFVARSKGPVGYPGFQCRHCKGHAGLGKYFPVSAKSLSTNSTSQNIHAHLLKCRKTPEPVKDRLVQLKIEKGRSPRLEPGWRKIFFDKVWARLHG